MHFKFFATLKPENQHRTGSFVKADFLRCLPKEKTFKRLSLNLYCFNDDTSTSGLTYTQEEADRTCDALLALSFSSLYIGVCGDEFTYERLLAQSKFKEIYLCRVRLLLSFTLAFTHATTEQYYCNITCKICRSCLLYTQCIH